MGFSAGQLVGGLSAPLGLVGSVPGVALVAPWVVPLGAAAGVLGSLLGGSGDGEAFFFSPLATDEVPKAAGWDLLPRALTAHSTTLQVGFPGSPPPPANRGREQIQESRTIKRRVEDAQEELEVVAAGWALHEAGEDPGWALFLFLGCDDPAVWFGVSGDLFARLSNVACRKPDLVMRTWARSALQNRAYLATASNTLSQTGELLSKAADELARVKPIYLEARSRERFRGQAEAIAAAQLQAAMQQAFADLRARITSGQVPQGAEADQVADAVVAVVSQLVDPERFQPPAPATPPVPTLPVDSLTGTSAAGAEPQGASALVLLLGAAAAVLLLFLVISSR